MSLLTLGRIVVMSGVLLRLAGGQSSEPAAPPAPPPLSRAMLVNLPQPPVPADPLELVPGNAQPVEDAAQRAAIINLLANAKALSNVRSYPYDLKTTFTVLGSSSSDGSWQLENISPGHTLYRWTAQGPGYSIVNLYKERLIYSNQPNVGIPLRVAQVRAAIFYVDSLFGARASIRTASASLNGVDLTCALTERMSSAKSFTGGRLWNESEFCIDPKSGLLMTYSPVPGLYIQYDYSNAVHFHGATIPGKFTITEAGRTVIEAHTESATDPGNLNPTLFDPSGLNVIGVGPMEAPPTNVWSMQYGPQGSSNGTIQFVVLHAMVTPDGHVSDTEVLASSDTSENQRALDIVKAWQNRPMMSESQQPGTAPQLHEVLFTLGFATGAGN